MADGVATATGLSLDKISELAHQYAYTSMGIVNFHQAHNIATPHVFVPATCHYSWRKAATVLGIGEDNLIHIKVDELARQDVTGLLSKKFLIKKLVHLALLKRTNFQV